MLGCSPWECSQLQRRKTISIQSPLSLHVQCSRRFYPLFSAITLHRFLHTLNGVESQAGTYFAPLASDLTKMEDTKPKKQSKLVLGIIKKYVLNSIQSKWVQDILHYASANELCKVSFWWIMQISISNAFKSNVCLYSLDEPSTNEKLFCFINFTSKENQLYARSCVEMMPPLTHQPRLKSDSAHGHLTLIPFQTRGKYKNAKEIKKYHTYNIMEQNQ